MSTTTTLKTLKDLGRAFEQAEVEDEPTCAEPCSGGSGATKRARASASLERGPRHGQPGPSHFMDYENAEDLAALEALRNELSADYWERYFEQRPPDAERPKYCNPTPEPIGTFTFTDSEGRKHSRFYPSNRIVTGYKDLAHDYPSLYRYQPNDTRKGPLPTRRDPLRDQVSARAELEDRSDTETGFRDVDGSWCNAFELMQGNRGTGMVRRIPGADRLAEKLERGEFRPWKKTAEDPILTAYPDGAGFTIVEKRTGMKEGRPPKGVQDRGEILALIDQTLEAHPEIAQLDRQQDRDDVLVSYLCEHDPPPQMIALAKVLGMPRSSVYNLKNRGQALRHNPDKGGRNEMQTADLIDQLRLQYQRDMTSLEERRATVEQLAALHPHSEIVQSAVDRFNQIALDAAQPLAA
jgi:hypothetical protein